MKLKLHKTRRLARQLGQGMTEYIIIVAVIAIGSIAVYSHFGDTLREQTASAAIALSGGASDNEKADAAATEAARQTEANLENFARGKSSTSSSGTE